MKDEVKTSVFFRVAGIKALSMPGVSHEGDRNSE